MSRQNRHRSSITDGDKVDPALASEITAKAPKSKTIGYLSGGKIARVVQPVRIRTKQIAIGIPLDEIMFSKFFTNYQGLTIMPWDDLLGTQSTYLPEARNSIHNMFVNYCEAEYLFMLDSDVLPPPNIIDRLLAHHLPMVGGWYRKKDGPERGQPVVYDFGFIDESGVAQWKIRKEPGTGLEKVDAAGAGCWMMRRDVAEAIGSMPYDMIRGGEDLDLCLKVRDKGFPIHIDWSLACAHAGVSFI